MNPPVAAGAQYHQMFNGFFVEQVVITAWAVVYLQAVCRIAQTTRCAHEFQRCVFGLFPMVCVEILFVIALCPIARQ